ncbi:glycerophosphodiester phosphodiesterase [Malacoplasma penetrans]|uniref:Glycerophosphoryl diester phosphodiesterase n=1 Tax=Malacoplasma penetrans (strain HF-2) TaxID=272633 RepID=Q8EVI9_MALP2|nr:glycerophosphodiester phosphodiesterase [Malacoplasma penetrans]RXY96907.1 glycerophosphodiester phosphodiesterase [Malacoplasma penetrans]BAC44365.1 glycerophosphoryl diester phosphodiesterase [Malacoplasma penetrans HF-2]
MHKKVDISKTHTKILAHRGYSGIAPENTELAFETAVNFGFDGFEIDVHLTKDNQLVVIHDEDTYRTSLVKKMIKDSTLKELKELDQAAFFKINCPKQEILTLKELLDKFLYRISYLNIEIKTDIIVYPNIEKYLDELVKTYDDAYEKIIFSSFNFNSLKTLHELNPKWTNGFLWWTKSQFKAVNPEEIKKVCKYLHPWTEIYKKEKDNYLKLGLPFNLWTIKDAKVYEHYAKDKDVHFLISNYKY